jgi:hypothetical protein
VIERKREEYRDILARDLTLEDLMEEIPGRLSGCRRYRAPGWDRLLHFHLLDLRVTFSSSIHSSSNATVAGIRRKCT